MPIDPSSPGRNAQSYDPETDDHPLPFASRGIRVGTAGVVVGKNDLGEEFTVTTAVDGEILPYYYTDILPAANGTTASDFTINE